MSELAVDQLIDGKYRIVRLIGQGAWATVYEAINVRIQRRVAIKILNLELASQPELCARFRREAEASTQIESPFVVTMFDAGSLVEEGNRPYIVMEFLEGEDLAQRLHRLGALEESVAVTYAIHLLSGLADAHATGVLHRDIKPDNLVIVKSKTGEEIVKLVDFGISKPNSRPSLRPPAPSLTNEESSGVIEVPEDPRMTTTDLVLGSPVYMSPEQARGTRYMDHRSDLFSVGVVLFELLTNEVPHQGSTFNDLMFKVALESAPDPRTKKPDLDAALATIIIKSLEREPTKRYQTAVEFRAALIEWAEQHGVRTPPNPFVTSKIRVRALPTPAPATKSSSAARLELDASPDSERESRPSLSEHVFTPAPAPAVASAPEKPTKRSMLPIAAAIVIAAMLAGGGIVVASLRKPTATVVVMQQQPSAVAVTTTAEPTPAPTPTPTPTPTPSVVAAATPAVQPTVVQPPVPRGSWPPAAPPAPPRPSTIASAAPAQPSAAPPPSTPTTPAAPATAASVEGRTVRTSF